MATTFYRMRNSPDRNARQYHRQQEMRDKSAVAENTRRQKDYEKNLAQHAERMLGLQAVFEHLSEPIPDDVEPYLENKVPEPKNRADLCKDFFRCNIWDVEPVLIDELSAARISGDKQRVDKLRQLIRAASWMKHSRTDSTIAIQKTREQAERFLQDHTLRHAMLSEEGFDRQAANVDADLVGIKQVIDTLDGFNTTGVEVEPAIRYVESALEQDWDEFLKVLKEEQAPWPENPGIKLEGKIGDLAERIESWRMIRDQLYFQRYNPNLSRLGKLHSAPKNPFSA